ncbi:PEP/pyruvate-binding domain-containing protein [Kribbella solani]|uniref:PEP/pyruvate-binding domain-containing protein n=1 Tax=Kribbella solani TaxID=236067 RepID=UPI0029B80993|nr:PEP/pyruvate-binding domain-containing protein [Kribbella solani]MDX2968440.1 PEP/pyruvate-binding domain-containing protein [Kribbella solani]
MTTLPTGRFVFDFAEGSMDQQDLLGGKGANLAEMTRLGLPVPPGFTIATTACRAYLETGDLPAGVSTEISAHLARLEEVMCRRLGDPADPLLISVRAGAKFSMPGMLETILDIGLTDESVHGLAKRSGDEHFAWDSYRRLLQMYARTVLDVPDEVLRTAVSAEYAEWGAGTPEELPAAAIERACAELQRAIAGHAGRPFPQDPREQLDLAVRAVFRSWSTPRAQLYRRQEHIPGDQARTSCQSLESPTRCSRSAWCRTASGCRSPAKVLTGEASISRASRATAAGTGWSGRLPVPIGPEWNSHTRRVRS